MSPAILMKSIISLIRVHDNLVLDPSNNKSIVKAVKGEDRIKDEPCYFEEEYNIIDDTIEYDPPKKRNV